MKTGLINAADADLNLQCERIRIRIAAGFRAVRRTEPVFMYPKARVRPAESV